MWTLENIYNVLDTRTTNVARRAGAEAFAEPSGRPTNGTMHTLDDIMILVTNRAPVPKTGQTASVVPYDDGWYGTNVGVAWPTQRFTAVATTGQETNQIRDNLTGLIWAKNANLVEGTAWGDAGTCTWVQAVDIITNYTGPVNGTNNAGQNGYGGTNDWRLPNKLELLSLQDYSKNSPALPAGHPFTDVRVNPPYYYWTSTGYATAPSSTKSAVTFATGSMNVAGATGTKFFVWPVRGGGQ
jgi:hypothetical protein